MKYQSGEEFLNHLYQNMHMEDVVMHTAEKGDKPEKKIERYMERLERVHNKAKESSHKMEVLKKFYYDKYVIKELPENYIAFQQRIAREEGHGNITVTDEMKENLLKQVQEDQKRSLDSWIDYLTSDDAMYPMWFKNYAFQGMLQLGKFDKEKRAFGKRSKTTTDRFMELNQETLAQVYNTLKKTITKDKLSKEEEDALNKGESFKKLYSYYYLNVLDKKSSQETDGVWIKYDQGSSYIPLWESLQGKNTGWCTAGGETAREQLKGGDFYVYYTKDENGEYKEPRIAIRMNGHDQIGEVRGVEKDQCLEDSMLDITDKKLDEFPDKERYKKKVHDMKLLTEIEKKHKNGSNLSKEELIFLYELDDKIEGFGWRKDPRIEEIKQERNLKKDFAFIYDCCEENIGLSEADFEENSIVYYFGDNLDIDKITDKEKLRQLKLVMGDIKSGDKKIDYLSNLQQIKGEACFNSLTEAKGLENLKEIGRDAYFSSLTDAKGLENLQYIGNNAYFCALTSAKGLENLKEIGRNAYFDFLTDARGLENLQYVGESAYFRRLTSAKGLENLQEIGGYAYFSSLIDARGLGNLKKISAVDFNSLTDAKGLENLKEIGRGEAKFNSLTDAKGLENLERIGGIADFRSLTDARGLENLKEIGESAYFSSLIDARGLENLQKIGGEVYFSSLTDARGLENLKEIGWDANFSSLIDAKGLHNLQKIDGYANFSSLTDAKGLYNLQKIYGYANFSSLISAKGLENLQYVETADFRFLTDARGLENLQKIEWNAHFQALTDARGLENLKEIGEDADFSSLIDAKGLHNLQKIERNANFSSLTDITGLERLNVYKRIYLKDISFSQEGFKEYKNRQLGINHSK